VRHASSCGSTTPALSLHRCKSECSGLTLSLHLLHRPPATARVVALIAMDAPCWVSGGYRRSNTLHTDDCRRCTAVLEQHCEDALMAMDALHGCCSSGTRTQALQLRRLAATATMPSGLRAINSGDVSLKLFGNKASSALRRRPW